VGDQPGDGLADYLDEEAIDNVAALIVWENPDYRDGR